MSRPSKTLHQFVSARRASIKKKTIFEDRRLRCDCCREKQSELFVFDDGSRMCIVCSGELAYRYADWGEELPTRSMY